MFRQYDQGGIRQVHRQIGELAINGGEANGLLPDLNTIIP